MRGCWRSSPFVTTSVVLHSCSLLISNSFRALVTEELGRADGATAIEARRRKVGILPMACFRPNLILLSLFPSRPNTLDRALWQTGTLRMVCMASCGINIPAPELCEVGQVDSDVAECVLPDTPLPCDVM